MTDKRVFNNIGFQQQQQNYIEKFYLFLLYLLNVSNRIEWRASHDILYRKKYIAWICMMIKSFVFRFFVFFPFNLSYSVFFSSLYL